MNSMFWMAESFNQNLVDWNISNVASMSSMLYNTSLCTENYDATLNGWATQNIQEDVDFGAWDNMYSTASESARATLSEKWDITDGGLGRREDDKCATPLSTKAFLTTNNLDISPNPVVDKLQIQSTSLSSYAIYNLTGNLSDEAKVGGQKNRSRYF